jgi:hypothetical protein
MDSGCGGIPVSYCQPVKGQRMDASTVSVRVIFSHRKVNPA